MNQTRVWRKLACIALCCSAGSWWATCSDSREETGAPLQKPNMSSENKEMAHCIGRFQFILPDALQVAGRSQSIYRVQVKTVALPEGGMKALWQDKVARIQALTPPRSVSSAVIRTLDLQPSVKAIWYFSNPDDPDVHQLEAIKPEGDHAVVASRSSLAGKEASVETLITNILAAYLPVTTHGFCVGDGTVASEPGRGEETLIAFEHKKSPNFELRFETTTVSEPDTRTYSGIEEEQGLAADRGGKLIVLRNHNVLVAGLEGKEIRISVAAPHDAPVVRFTWHFPGVAEDSLRPMVNIVAIAPASEQAQLEAIWGGLLKSLRRVPPALAGDPSNAGTTHR
jgi:hypothetical protein